MEPALGAKRGRDARVLPAVNATAARGARKESDGPRSELFVMREFFDFPALWSGRDFGGVP